MPGCRRWLQSDAAFRAQYVVAREQQADALFDEILDIADDGTNDFVEKESRTGLRTIVLREEARKWMIARFAPKKYARNTAKGRIVRHPAGFPRRNPRGGRAPGGSRVMKVDHLKDRLWRLRNLYSIKEAETGRVIPFVPRPEQEAVFQALAEGHRKLIILKDRRLGMSTAIDVYVVDEEIFHAGRQISIVDRNQDDASKKLRGICKVAFESLPAAIRERFLVVRDNDSSLQLQTLSGDTVSAI